MRLTIRTLMMSVVVFIFMMPTDGSAFRCGSHLVNTGDKSFEVSQKCGEPISKETVGYTVKGDRRELEIKEWIYGPWNGQYYYLTFHGTTLVQIESRKDPKD